ncbi:MAG: hypothetical protein AAB289_02395, partial [Chloroflexota bacterium]
MATRNERSRWQSVYRALSVVVTLSMLHSFLPPVYAPLPVSAADPVDGGSPTLDPPAPPVENAAWLPDNPPPPPPPVVQPLPFGRNPTAPLVAQVESPRGVFSSSEKLPNGVRTTSFTTRPQSWRDPVTKELRAFDSSIRAIPATRPVAGFAHEAANGPVQVHFATAERAGGGKSAVRLTNGAAQLAIKVDAVRPTRETVADGRLTYEGAWPGVDLQYTVDGERVKEEIIIKNRASAVGLPVTGDRVVLGFDLEFQRLTVTAGAKGSWVFAGSDGKPQFTMLPSFAVDRGKNLTGRAAVATTVTANPAGARVELALDAAWLTDAARVYPVVIDPSFIPQSFAPPESGSLDTYIEQGSPSTAHDGESILKAGLSGGNATHA